MNNKTKICLVEGCDKPVKSHGYCNTHNEQIRKHGHLLEPKILNKDKICRIDGCDSPVRTKGLCKKHYNHQFIKPKIKKPKKEKILKVKIIKPYQEKDWLNKKYNIELLSTEEIAELNDISESNIYKYLNKFKISLKYTEPELHSRLLYVTKKLYSINSMKNYLYEEYWINNKSTCEIGDNLKLNSRQIIKWMDDFNISKRDKNEKRLILNAKNINPTNKQWQIILGSWMGDGSIRLVHKNANFRLTHCKEQYDYLKYKKNILEENNLLWFNEYEKIENGNGYGQKGNISYNIESQCTPLFNDIHSKCYINGKANFNIDYLYQIDDYGLYIWYLDDGSLLPNNTIIICTDNFTYEDNLHIQKYFLDVFNVETKIFTVPGLTEVHYRQRINPSGFEKFIGIINKYKDEVESMKYKLEKREVIKR